VDKSKIPYDENYKDKCKMLWYSLGRVEPMQVVRSLKKDNVTDEHGRFPTNIMVAKWMRELSWHIWADEMDAKAMVLVEDDLIMRKVAMLRQQAERGFELQMMGMKSLREDGFDSSSSAVQAVKVGVDIERTARGIGEMILKLAKMDDDTLVNEIQKELSKGVSGQVIEAEEVDTESTPQE
jgi:hypothetical protein